MLMAALDGGAWRAAVVTLRALNSSLEKFWKESDLVFEAWKRDKRHGDAERLEGLVAAVELAATGCFEVYRPVLGGRLRPRC